MFKLLSAFGILIVFAATAAADPVAQIELVNLNAANVGLNDPTPAAPVGGNPGTTLGEQRLLALQHAADIWASRLRSHVPVRIQVAFAPRPCAPTAAVLASAGAIWVDLNFKRAPLEDTWYHGALANRLAKTDLAPEDDELIALFNINLGSADCLAGSPFYYGFDGNEGNGIDLVATALHEFAHGLGFSQFANVSTGALFLGVPDVYNRNLFDTTQGRFWDEMTDAQRQASAINDWNVVWTGQRVTAAVPRFLDFGVPGLRINDPDDIEGFYKVGTAAFGPPLGAPGVTGEIVVALDEANAAGPSASDGCTIILNAAEVAGKVAMVDRGTCAFTVKTKNLQDAGAIGAIIVNNAAGSAPQLGGADPTITIPAVGFSMTDGALIKAELAAMITVNGTLGVDESRRAGANDDGLALMNAPNPVQPGSSISHWDPVASPNLLMEPAINSDLSHDLDLSYPLMLDLGWLRKANGPP